MAVIPLPKVDDNSPVPRYLQAKSILAEAIRSGSFSPGCKLPNTGEIGAAINVSLITAHKAIQCLVEEGWLRRERGRGTFVRGDYAARIAARASFRVALTMHPSVQLDDFYHGAVMAGIQEAAEESDQIGEMTIQRRDMSEGLATVQGDALLCFHPYLHTFDRLEEEARQRTVVILGGSAEGPNLHCIDSENRQGARQAVRHLIELGHRRVAILNGPLAASNCLHRFEGYMEEMIANSMPVRHEWVFNAEVARTAGDALSGLAQALRGVNRPTAVLACGYYLALDVMTLLRDMGLSIPGDISLIGFDDARGSDLLNPPLTTVSQPLKDMGRRAYQRVLNLMNGRPPAQRVLRLPTELIVRGSTAAPGQQAA